MGKLVLGGRLSRPALGPRVLYEETSGGSYRCRVSGTHLVCIEMSTAAQASTAPRPTTRPSLTGRIRLALSGLLAGFLGIAPHVIHHVGPSAGGALFGGLGGSLLFGVIGLVAAIPFLLRVHRRTGGWRLPAAMLAAFAVIFSISTFVIGPAISGEGSASSSSTSATPADPATPGTTSSHAEHH